MHRAAATDTASMEPTASTSEAATTSAAAAGQRIIRNQRRANQHDGCKNNESVSKHGISPLDQLPCTPPNPAPIRYVLSLPALRGLIQIKHPSSANAGDGG
jgi:hypothetical protein